METLKFKTNIKCGGCVAAVTPYLNDDDKIKNWQVNIEHADKILKVTSGYTAGQINDLLNKAGYNAELID